MSPRNYQEMAKKSWLNRTKPHKGGFNKPGLASEAGKVGGKRSRRGKSAKEENTTPES